VCGRTAAAWPFRRPTVWQPAHTAARSRTARGPAIHSRPALRGHSGARDEDTVYAATTTAAHHGVDSFLVRVEARITTGSLPQFIIVGLPDAAVREGAERVRAAIRATTGAFPQGRCVVNLSPAWRRKAGSAFDLAIAMAILAADKKCPASALARSVFIGELGLNGGLRRISGSLPAAIAAGRAGRERLVLPSANAHEASVAASIDILAARDLAHALRLASTGYREAPVRTDAADLLASSRGRDANIDLSDVRGLVMPRRALEIAAAGGHPLLMCGPPGAGKTMLARRLPTLLPPLTVEEAIETTSVYSVAGLSAETPLVTERPFRAPHHTTSGAGLVGGGSFPVPGEISLAHNGVLFLDELPEFSPVVLNQLREPLEDKRLTISRAGAKVTFPARFLLVAAMNPCPCGYWQTGVRECRCADSAVMRYRGRLSGPLLDRIDLHVAVPSTDYGELRRRQGGESSSVVRERVLAAIEHRRRAGVLEVTDAARLQLEEAAGRFAMSARAIERCLAVARTIAHLALAERVGDEHAAEAVQYRTSLEASPSSTVLREAAAIPSASAGQHVNAVPRKLRRGAASRPRTTSGGCAS